MRNSLTGKRLYQPHHFLLGRKHKISVTLTHFGKRLTHPLFKFLYEFLSTLEDVSLGLVQSELEILGHVLQIMFGFLHLVDAVLFPADILVETSHLQ